MSHRASTLLLLVALFAAQMFGQGLDTTAAKDDWEEINFEFNSPVLVDGYPSLLRLAELLKNNPNYRVRVEGHADYIGSNRYNDRLATRRAETVKSFLVKYGATDGQITPASQGERAPKVNSRNRDGRFMNRRVIFTVTDAQGNAVRDMAGTPVQMATINDVIRKLDELSGKQDATRDAILRRLDRLDDIAGLLEKLAGQNQQLQDRVRALEQQNTQIRETVQTLPNRQETATIVDTRLEANRDRRYGQINISGGVDDNRNLTLMGRGRFFAPFKDRVAIQAQGEYNYFRSQREGQGDVGVIARAGNFQAGMFGSLKYVSLRTTQSGVSQLVPTQRLLDAAGSSSGYLGQFSFLGDFILPRGKIGIFATRKFRDGAVIGRTPLVSALTFPGATGATSVTSSNVYTETFLGVMNQFGGSATIGLAGDSYIEANFAGLRSEYLRNYRAGGGARLVLPLSPLFAFTIEGDLNPTLVSATNTTRIMAGLQFGNFIRPKEFGTLTTPVPMDIPRVRYEVLTRTVRNGNGTPTADAGGDLSGIAAGPITLNGSRSFDPDGDALTYQWEQIAGPSVSLSGANTSTATFTAAQGQVYSFRLTVTDTQGARGIDRATVTTQAAARVVRIVSFAASPASIMAGQASTLNYSVENAESVTIEGIGTVNATSGSSQVSPQQTTTYRLVARGGGSEVVATTVVTVTQMMATARFLACSIAPGTITAGQSATITYATENATQVSISGIGNVEPSGSRTVTPTQTTNYTLTATGQSGAAATCSLAVTVSPVPVAAPRIVSFVANPATVTAGAGSILQYAVEGATTVTISGVSQQLQPNSGSVPVNPAQTTTYTLTAVNQTGQVTSTATVTVNAVTPTAPTLTACSANPTTSAAAGNPVVLNFTAANATAVSVDNGVGTVPVGGGVTVRPQATTTYTVTATGANNQTASCQIVVTVTVGPGPTAVIAQGDSIETISRQIMLDASPSTNPGGGQLTYQWEPLGVGAAVLDQGQPMTRIQIGGLFGDYQIRLTVRNAAGQSSTAIITVRFRSTSVF